MKTITLHDTNGTFSKEELDNLGIKTFDRRGQAMDFINQHNLIANAVKLDTHDSSVYAVDLGDNVFFGSF